jgi:hygromycin-B 7''-O-kinase
LIDALPHAVDEAGYDALCADDAALAPGVAALLAGHGLAGESVQRFDSGSLPVYAVGDAHVLKLFPPDEQTHADIEAGVLAAVQGRLPIPTPRLVAAERHDGWPYVLMSRLRGERLVDAWPHLSEAERDRAADTLGQAVAALHAIDTVPLADLRPAWHEFLPAQRTSAAERQQKPGLAALWVQQVEGFLARWMPAPAPRLALLHTELMREHLTVHQGHLAGLFDFEPAMIGAPEYDFASTGLFVACGEARTLRRILLAYGYAPAALDENLSMRLMAYALLHRYSNLRWYLERLPAPEATTLEHLALRWFNLVPY